MSLLCEETRTNLPNETFPPRAMLRTIVHRTGGRQSAPTQLGFEVHSFTGNQIRICLDLGSEE